MRRRNACRRARRGLHAAAGALALAAACVSCSLFSPAKPNPLGGCPICHVDVVDDLRGTLHETRGVGCVKCHGPSAAHSADELNEVAPDRVYAPGEVDAHCGSCHRCTSADARDAGRTCVDCHAAHRTRLRGDAAAGDWPLTWPGGQPQRGPVAQARRLP